jgi:hypothetical protein
LSNKDLLGKKTLWLALGRIFSEGVATLPLPKNHHLRRFQTRGLWKLTDLTGLWTHFEVALGGNEPTVPWKTFGFPQVLGRASKSTHVGHAPTAPTARDFFRPLLEQKDLDVRPPRPDTMRPA